MTGKRHVEIMIFDRSQGVYILARDCNSVSDWSDLLLPLVRIKVFTFSNVGQRQAS